MRCLLLFLALMVSANAQKLLQSRQFVLAANYDKEDPPPNPGGMNKTFIQATFNLRNILDLSETLERISLEVSLTLFWYDGRIEVNKTLLHGEDERGRYLTLTKSDAAKFWTPDLYIDKVRSIRGPNKVFYFIQPVTLRLYEDSRVSFSSRMNFDVACDMDFYNFPFDKQTCDINILSFNLGKERLLMQWLHESEAYFGDPKSKLPDFHHSIELVGTCPKEDTYAHKQRQALTIRFNLVRSWTPYIMFYYIPTATFTFYGWALNFVLRHHPKSMLKIILTLVTLQGGMLARLPNVSYLTFFSYWSLFCIMPIYSMVWQWTTSNTVRNMENTKLANRISDAFMYIVPAISIVFSVVYWALVFIIAAGSKDSIPTPACLD